VLLSSSLGLNSGFSPGSLSQSRSGVRLTYRKGVLVASSPSSSSSSADHALRSNSSPAPSTALGGNHVNVNPISRSESGSDSSFGGRNSNSKYSSSDRTQERPRSPSHHFIQSQDPEGERLVRKLSSASNQNLNHSNSNSNSNQVSHSSLVTSPV
jgi:hypothetical protein